MELRGVYGGLFLGIGLLMLVFTRHEPWLRLGLVALAVIVGGLVVGRTLGLLIDGPANPFLYALLISEITGLVIALVALRR